MSRRTGQRIADILRCCGKILRYTSGMTPDQFNANELVTDAVLRNFEIIGEATKHIPDDVRARMPGIEWRRIAGMRDWVAHVYFHVDPDTVWDAISTKIPELSRTL